jgi:creatinine amidohydrolase
MPNVLLSEMTWPEARDFIRNTKAALVPVGAMEQHGHHMTQEVDIALASFVTKKVAEALYPRALVAPDVPIGVSWHHMKYAGSMTLRESTLIEYCYDVAKSLKHHGIGFVIFINGHFGNVSALAVACNKIRHELGIKVIQLSYDLIMEHEVPQDSIEEGLFFSHAGEAETSMMMALKPSGVRMGKLKRTETFTMDPKKFRLFLQADDQFPIYDVASKDGLDFASAEKATVEKGTRLNDRLVEVMIALISDLLNTY